MGAVSPTVYVSKSRSGNFGQNDTRTSQVNTLVCSSNHSYPFDYLRDRPGKSKDRALESSFASAQDVKLAVEMRCQFLQSKITRPLSSIALGAAIHKIIVQWL